MRLQQNEAALSTWQLLDGQRVRRIPRRISNVLVKSQNVKVCTINVGTLRGRSREVVEMLARRKVDICCIQEVRYRNEGCMSIGSNEEKYKLWYVGNDESTNGVGVLMKSELAENVIEVKRYNDRFMCVKLILGETVWHVFSLYAPQVGRSSEEKQCFWEKVEDEIGKVPPADGLLIGGDVNAHVGANISGYEEVLGRYGFGERNAEGAVVLDLCKNHGLRILNSFFKKEKEKLITFKSGEAETQIDLLLMRKRAGATVLDCTVIPGEACMTQHRLVRAALRIKGHVARKRIHKKKIKVWRLKDEERRREYEEEFARSVKQGDGSWNSLVECATEAGIKVCGEMKGKRGRERETWWWNEAVQRAVKEKKEAYKVCQRSGNETDRHAYCSKKREARRCVAISKKNAWFRWSEGLTTREGRNRMFRAAAQMKKDRADIQGTRYVKDESGAIKVKETEVRETWRRYFDGISNEGNDITLHDIPPAEGPIADFTLEEVKEAVISMKNGKAPGPSNVNAEMLKLAGEPAVEALHAIFQHIALTGECPKKWSNSLTVALFKGKGDPLSCHSYRGLRLLEHGMKIFEKVLEKRLRSLVSIGEQQFAYSRGKSCTDAIFIIRRLQERYMEKKKKLFHIFVDLQKAFDRVPRDVIRWALRRQKVPEHLINLVMSLYVDTTSKVCVAGGMSEDFGIGVGVHQGSALSPLLFILVMEEATKDRRKGGLMEMLYADDLVLTGGSKEEVEEMFKKWKEDMESKGLKVNIQKTKMLISGSEESPPLQSRRFPCGVCGRGVGANSILCQSCDKWCHKRCSGLTSLTGVTNFQCSMCVNNTRSTDEDERCVIDGVEIDVVKEFCYLGDVLSCKGGSERAVRARIASAWRKWKDLASLLRNRHVPLKCRGHVYSACIRPVLLYGAESWALTQHLAQQLRSFDRRMLRYMTGVSLSDRVDSAEVAGRCGLKQLEVVLRERRLRWFGHVKRRTEEEPIHRVLNVAVEGPRPRGRPRRSWLQTIQEEGAEADSGRHTGPRPLEESHHVQPSPRRKSRR